MNLFRRHVGVRVETWMSAGRYIHTVYNVGGQAATRIPEEVVDRQRKLNEAMYDHMPNGSERLVSFIRYVPGKRDC